MNKHLINKNNLKVNKITYKSDSIILHTPLGLFIIKNNENIKLYDYLFSRGFNYFLPIIDYDNSSILFKYEEGLKYDINERALDYIKLISLLHNKTSYYVNVTKEDNEKYYKKLINNLNNIKKYYDELSSLIENKDYYSPNEYLFIRNISIIYKNIFNSYDLINKWYDKYKNNTRKRICTLFNNYDLNNILRTKNNMYLYDFSNSYKDSPIYDLNNFYKKYYLDFNFKDLYNCYTKVIELNDYEKDLLIILNIFPTKIIIKNNMEDIFEIKKKISKFYIDDDLLNFEKEKDRSTHKNKNNK